MQNIRAGASAQSSPQAQPKARFGLMLFLVALLAFAIRQHYVLSTIVDIPIRGDINAYVGYAWNLATHGIYSSAIPPDPPLPDSYRSPGYPWLIALGMYFWRGDAWDSVAGWYPFVLEVQVLLGTATCVLVALLARHWLKPAWAILAALLLALWPHHVAATGTLLSEVLFGFVLTLACWLFARAWTTGKTAWFGGCGAAFGFAYLVNPLVALFPLVLGAIAWRDGRRKAAAIVLAVFVLPVAVLAVRNATLPPDRAGSSERAIANFVQGSWPQYHAAARHFRSGDPVSVAIMEEMDRETTLLEQDRSAGLATIAARMSHDPLRYLFWYSLQKPLLLWDWDIQLGAGGIYALEVRNSPLDKPALHQIVRLYQTLNPFFSVVTLVASLVVVVVARRRPPLAPLMATAALALYVTAIHVVLQAEPRYATAYRPLEAAMVATAVAWLIQRFRVTREG